MNELSVKPPVKQYAILKANMERLTKKLIQIQKKCRKYGCDFHFAEVGEEFRKIKTETGYIQNVRFVLVEVEGKAIVNGWKFIATVEHTANGNIIRSAYDEEVPVRYYTSQPVCEHCQSRRYRKDTFIVMNEETGEFKQVGKSCLADFTHGMSAEGVASYIALFDELIKGEAPMESGWGERYFDTAEFLQYVAETIRGFGYRKNDPYSFECSTRDRASDYLVLNHGGFRGPYDKTTRERLQEEMERVSFNPDRPEIVKLAADARNWAIQQEETNNYMHNLITACKLDHVTHKHFGILASLFPAYDRELEYQARKAAEEAKRQAEAAMGKNSVWVGNLKDRITILVQSFKCVTSWETEFGTTRVYKIVDETGNVFTWKTSTFIEDGVKSITGTIKAHNEFRGVKQTELTRCRVA